MRLLQQRCHNFFFIILCLLFIFPRTIEINDDTTNITIFRIKSTNETSHKIQNITIEKLNRENSEYKFNLIVLDCNGSDGAALEYVVKISKLYDESRNKSIISPIILGAAWSSFNVLISRLFHPDIFSLLQISAASTSPTLSQTKFLSFTRTIPNDLIQAETLSRVIEYYGWERVGIIHVDGAYGEQFKQTIENTVSNTTTILSKTYIHNDTTSIERAAKFVKDSKLYITILIVHGADMLALFEEFERIGIAGYPYYYIGCDAWFDIAEIKEHRFGQYVSGFIGTMPGTPSMLTSTQWKNIYNGTDAVHNSSVKINNYIINQMKEVFNETISAGVASYAYDAMYAAATTIYKWLANKTHNDSISIDLEEEYYLLRQILIDETNFNGASGTVGLDINGDRTGSIVNYVVSVIESKSDIKHIGVIANNTYKPFNDTAIWPQSFIDKGHPPRSIPKPTDIKYSIDRDSLITFGAIYIVLFLASLKLYCSNKKKTLYIMMICVIPFCGVSIIFYGIQNYKYFVEHNEEYHVFQDIACNINVFLLSIGFTISFLPLFISYYQLTRILVKKKEKATDKDIYNILFKLLIGDIIILIIFGITSFIIYYFENIKLLSYEFDIAHQYINDDDPLEEIFIKYPTCSTHWSMNIFYVIILIYKFIELQTLYQKSHVIVPIVILSIVLFSVFLNNALKDNIIDTEQQYIISSSIIVFLNVSWIIPEYLSLCGFPINNEDSSTTDPTRTSKSTTDPQLELHQHLDNSDVDIEFEL